MCAGGWHYCMAHSGIARRVKYRCFMWRSDKAPSPVPSIAGHHQLKILKKRTQRFFQSSLWFCQKSVSEQKTTTFPKTKMLFGILTLWRNGLNTTGQQLHGCEASLAGGSLCHLLTTNEAQHSLQRQHGEGLVLQETPECVTFFFQQCKYPRNAPFKEFSRKMRKREKPSSAIVVSGRLEGRHLSLGGK